MTLSDHDRLAVDAIADAAARLHRELPPHVSFHIERRVSVESAMDWSTIPSRRKGAEALHREETWLVVLHSEATAAGRTDVLSGFCEHSGPGPLDEVVSGALRKLADMRAAPASIASEKPARPIAPSTADRRQDPQRRSQAS